MRKKPTFTIVRHCIHCGAGLLPGGGKRCKPCSADWADKRDKERREKLKAAKKVAAR